MINGIFPTSLTTKSDYYFAIDNVDPNHTVQLFVDLLDSLTSWHGIGKIEGLGVSNSTHKIVFDKQYEYGYRIDCRMTRLGFTISEVEGIIALLRERLKVYNTNVNKTEVTVIIN